MANNELYVDGFVIVVPKKNFEEYKKMAEQGKEVWLKYGALDYKECVGDDLAPDMQGMPMLAFPKLAGTNPDEDVWFSFIVFASREHRDQVNAKVMADPAMSPEKMKEMPMPFDMKKFSYGGFKVIVNGNRADQHE